MNSLDDLLDRIRESFTLLWSRVEENSTYNTLREQIESLPTSTQKLLKIGGIGVFLFVLFWIPISSILGASSYISEFDQKRKLIEQLIEASVDQQKGSPLPPGLNSAALQARVRAKVGSLRLVEGQGPNLTPLGPQAAGNLAPKSVEQAGVSVAFQGLNFKQVLEAGSLLETLDASVKMVGLKVQPSQQYKKYYDASFQLVSFSLPVTVKAPGSDADQQAKPDKKGSKRRAPPKRGRKIRKRGSK